MRTAAASGLVAAVVIGRLIVRARARYTPVWPPWIVRTLVLVGFGIRDFQAGAMLLGIRPRVLA
jgi:hypothetical protein